MIPKSMSSTSIGDGNRFSEKDHAPKLSREQRIELACFLERVEFVAPADMRGADEHLGKGARPIRLLDHLCTQLALAGRVDFPERHALARQQLACRVRVIAEIPRVDHDFSHMTYAS